MAAQQGEAVRFVRVDWRVVVLCALGLTILFTFQNYTTLDPRRPDVSLWRSFVQQVAIWASWLAVAPIIFAVARRWRASRRFTLSGVLNQLVISVVIALLQGALAGLGRWVLGVSLSPQLGDVMANSVGTYLGTGIIRYWLIALAYHAVAYHHEVREREVGAARLETRLALAKLEALQSRLHPHFLFNTLNSIAALIREDPAAAERMIEHLGELLRASLATEPHREETLGRELDLVRQYVAIQKMRYRERLDVAIDVSPELFHLEVPHLLLQPIVENAIRHGLTPREEGGRVRIHAERRGGTLVLQVEDDGVGLGASGSHATTGQGGFGVSSTRARLAHLYGDRGTLDIRQAGGATGTIVTIELPAQTSPAAGAQP